ncbi:hypothetical protein POUND7_006959 [Theobroma cacao]
MMSSSEFNSLSRLLVFLCLALQYINGTDTPEQGQSITFSKTVISAGMKFELGFFSPRNSSRWCWACLGSLKLQTWSEDDQRCCLKGFKPISGNALSKIETSKGSVRVTNLQCREDLLTFDLASSVNGDDRDLTEANEPNEPGTPMMRDVKLPFFSFSSVSAATNNFSATIKVGEGGFGAMQWRRSI